MANMYKENLKKVIAYLRGDLDIYDGNHSDVVLTWDDAWDEMRFLGYNPETVDGIRAYILNELS